MKKPAPIARHMGDKLKEVATERGLKPRDIAPVFGVQPPSVYDWIEHGRIHKKHYATLVEWSQRPLSWWLDLPPGSLEVNETPPTYSPPDPRHATLLELFDSLPSSEQDGLLQDLATRKQRYDVLVEELLARRKAA